MRISPLDGPTKAIDRQPIFAVWSCIDELDEAERHLGRCLDSRDTTRLIAERVFRQLGALTAIYLADASRKDLVPVNGDDHVDEHIRACFTSGSLQHHETRVLLPLTRENLPFGVLEMVYRPDYVVDVEALEPIAARVSAMMLNALSFEHSRARALIDPLTTLPNERSFYSLLESYTASPDTPFTVLTIDINAFDKINARLGHATGDQVLHVTAAALAGCIRQMDRLARSSADEFMLLLPRVDGAELESVMARLSSSVRDVIVSGVDTPELRLNYGWASFPSDGDAAAALLYKARLRRQIAKSASQAQVILFPSKTQLADHG